MTTEQKIKEILTDFRAENSTAEHDMKTGMSNFMTFTAEQDKIEVDAINKISSLIPKWRKVEEELPEDRTDILFIPENNEHGNGYYLGYFSNNSFTDWEYDEDYAPDAVLYWIPESELLNLIPK